MKLISQLNFSPQILDQNFASLSGGEKVKIHLAALFFQNPDILLLDEPTNHLDEAGLIWLEKSLKTYHGILIMVTHDRYLINQTANYISELSPETHNLTHFRGNYRNYLQEKERQYLRQKQIREQQEKEINFIEKKLDKLYIIKSAYVVNKIKRRENKMGFDARGARKQKSHKRIVNQLKNKKNDLEENLVKVPLLSRRKLEIDLSTQEILSEDFLIKLQNLSKSYQGKCLFKNLSFELCPADRLVIKGANGTGKSTLLKIIMGIIKADEGMITIPEQAKLGFLDQEQETINLSQTIIEFIKNNPLIKLEEKEIWKKLEEFAIFYPQELLLPLSQLSIGCRQKAQLVQIILQQANVLILDEPTNHIDLLSLEKIEEQLINFPGPVLVASHDRYFIEKVGNRIVNIEKFR
jgi:ATPase subunit of ABC transporter with duplicated ATPase domains